MYITPWPSENPPQGCGDRDVLAAGTRRPATHTWNRNPLHGTLRCRVGAWRNSHGADALQRQNRFRLRDWRHRAGSSWRCRRTCRTAHQVDRIHHCRRNGLRKPSEAHARKVKAVWLPELAVARHLCSGIDKAEYHGIGVFQLVKFKGQLQSFTSQARRSSSPIDGDGSKRHGGDVPGMANLVQRFDVMQDLLLSLGGQAIGAEHDQRQIETFPLQHAREPWPTDTCDVPNRWVIASCRELLSSQTTVAAD
mmetsp:Transcript_9161/g.25600  ORF Transcript_9161/g.25600 Transcript_9161/m.25600 type:complete len:251 (+) Transcript_9161:48-800(+)